MELLFPLDYQNFWYFRNKIIVNSYNLELTGQGIFSLGMVPRKRHSTEVLSELLFTEEFQMEPLALNVICYYTSPEKVLDQIG